MGPEPGQPHPGEPWALVQSREDCPSVTNCLPITWQEPLGEVPHHPDVFANNKTVSKLSLIKRKVGNKMK